MMSKKFYDYMAKLNYERWGSSCCPSLVLEMVKEYFDIAAHPELDRHPELCGLAGLDCSDGIVGKGGGNKREVGGLDPCGGTVRKVAERQVWR